MENQFDPSHRLEVRDATGSTVGYFLPVGELGLWLGQDHQRLKELENARVEWEQLRKELVEERDSLRAEVAKLQAERRQHLQALYALIPSHFTFDEQEILDLEQKGLTLDQILPELMPAKGTK